MSIAKKSVCAIAFMAIIMALLGSTVSISLNYVNADTKASKSIDKVVKYAKKREGKSIRSFPSYFNNGRWCADFVYYVSKKTKVANNKVYPKKRKSSVSSLMSWYKNKGRYHKNTKKFDPKKGDLVFLSTTSHVGIVAKETSSYVYLIHGNWSNKVKYTKLKKRGYTSSQRAEIKGYARPNY